jgi:hypothetical protein
MHSIRVETTGRPAAYPVTNCVTGELTVVTVDGGYRWTCSCGCEGSAHESHQMAMEMGIQLTWIMAGENEHER